MAVAPDAKADPSFVEREAFAQKNLAPKLDLMCGSQLSVHYDHALGANENGSALCEGALRWLFYTCGQPEARRTIASAHLRRYECRAAGPGKRSSLSFADGVLITSWRSTDNDLPARKNDLENVFHAASPSQLPDVWTSAKDSVWEAFTKAPVPAITSTSYCEVDGKKMPLPVTGEPLVPPTARVRCVSNGKVITDLVPQPGGYTGFSTVVETHDVVYHTWRNGYLDGESWIRLGKFVINRKTYVSGHVLLEARFSPKDGSPLKRTFGVPYASSMTFGPGGVIMELECGSTASQDPVFRDYCGYDKPKKVTVHEQTGARTFVYDKGQITSVTN